MGGCFRLALAGHNSTDGILIGLGFQTGVSVGVAVSLAVIALDFADGVKTVSLMLANRSGHRRRCSALR